MESIKIKENYVYYPSLHFNGQEGQRGAIRAREAGEGKNPLKLFHYILRGKKGKGGKGGNGSKGGEGGEGRGGGLSMHWNPLKLRKIMYIILHYISRGKKGKGGNKGKGSGGGEGKNPLKLFHYILRGKKGKGGKGGKGSKGGEGGEGRGGGFGHALGIH